MVLGFAQRAPRIAIIVGFVVGAGLSGCSSPPATCMISNCSGCCTDDGQCLGPSKQDFHHCGSGGVTCDTCLPDETCTNAKCVPGSGTGGGGGTSTGGGGATGGGSGGGGGVSTGGGGSSTGGGTGGGGGATGGGSGGGTGGGASTGGGGGTSTGGGGATGGGTGGGSTGGGGGSTGGGTGGGSTGGGAGTGAIGDACSSGAQCATSQCAVLGFPNGYCTKNCSSNSDCPGGSVCGHPPSASGTTQTICLSSCSMPGSAPGGCRTSYVCDKHGTSLDGSPACFPGCASTVDCGGVVSCDSRGFCCGVDTAACCGGTMCNSGGCNGGYCGAGTGGGGGTGGGTGGSGGGTGGGSGGGTGGGSSNGIGSACSSGSSCASNTCFTVSGDFWPGGYCTQDCTSSGCPSGSSCSPAFGSTSYCLQDCTWNGGQSSCRSGYICEKNLVTGGGGSCLYACQSGSDCPVNGSVLTTCDTTNGYCCGDVGFRQCSSGSGYIACFGGGSAGGDGYCH